MARIANVAKANKLLREPYLFNLPYAFWHIWDVATGNAHGQANRAALQMLEDKELPAGSTVAHIGCGSSLTQLVACAEMGFAPTGIDNSAIALDLLHLTKAHTGAVIEGLNTYRFADGAGAENLFGRTCFKAACEALRGDGHDRRVHTTRMDVLNRRNQAGPTFFNAGISCLSLHVIAQQAGSVAGAVDACGALLRPGAYFIAILPAHLVAGPPEEASNVFEQEAYLAGVDGLGDYLSSHCAQWHRDVSLARPPRALEHDEFCTGTEHMQHISHTQRDIVVDDWCTSALLSGFFAMEFMLRSESDELKHVSRIRHCAEQTAKQWSGSLAHTWLFYIYQRR